MNIADTIEVALADVETFAEAKLVPWLENIATQVEHDVVSAILPIIETSGAQVAAAIVSGQPIAAIGDVIAAIALQSAKNMEKVGVTATAQDFSAALAGYLATLSKVPGGVTTAVPAA